MKQLVIIPTYNECENIGRMIETVLALRTPFHLLIVDDGSPDGTGQIIKSYQQRFPDRLFLIERSGKLGLGTAYIAGFHWGIARDYAYICEMDADFSHNPNDLEHLITALHNGADVAVGSRYVVGGNVDNWTWDRIVLSYGASMYVRFVTRMPVKDPTAGFVAYRSQVLSSIDLSKIRFVGYAFQIEMKFAARQLGFKITEVPITFVDRVLGSSKMNLGIFNEGILGVLQMRWRSFFNSYALPKI